MTKPTTTTTSSTVGASSTSVAVASGDGIKDDVSTVSGIGISCGGSDPTVTNIAGYSGTTATLTLSAAQELESGVTLTFGGGAGEKVTIAGNIEIKEVGKSHGSNMSLPNWNGYIYFDLEKLVVATNEAS